MDWCWEGGGGLLLSSSWHMRPLRQGRRRVAIWREGERHGRRTLASAKPRTQSQSVIAAVYFNIYFLWYSFLSVARNTLNQNSNLDRIRQVVWINLPQESTLDGLVVHRVDDRPVCLAAARLG